MRGTYSLLKKKGGGVGGKELLIETNKILLVQWSTWWQRRPMVATNNSFNYNVQVLYCFCAFTIAFSSNAETGFRSS